MSEPLIRVQGLAKHYAVGGGFLAERATVRALDDVSFELEASKTLAVVGESGCGKSTLAKLLMGIERPTSGSIKWRADATYQMVFQDPYGSLNPRKRLWELVSEPLRHGTSYSLEERYEAAIRVMEKVGLREELAERFPHMLSGGQRQRIGIARALTLRPKVMICDEPVSALDVSIQAQVLNLLLDLQQELGIAFIFISHDLGVVRHVSDQVMVIYLGKVVEYGSCEQVFKNPLHPYTKALLGCTPDISRSIAESQLAKSLHVRGELPSPFNPPPGCAFHKRCPLAVERCRNEIPKLRAFGSREAACHEILRA